MVLPKKRRIQVMEFAHGLWYGGHPEEDKDQEDDQVINCMAEDATRYGQF